MDPELISFDADGTLARSSFIDEFYFKVVPQYYAKYHDTDFDSAKEKVKSEYDSVGPENINWYKPSYWVKKFGFEESANDLVEESKHQREIYEETETVLEKLNENYPLIVISNAPSEFLEVQLEGIKHYFDEIYSCVSHFEKTKNDHMVYEIIFEEMDVVPKNAIHIGDDYKFDYKAAKKAGAEAIYLDREDEGPDEKHKIRKLREILDIVNR